MPAGSRVAAAQSMSITNGQIQTTAPKHAKLRMSETGMSLNAGSHSGMTLPDPGFGNEPRVPLQARLLGSFQLSPCSSELFGEKALISVYV